MILAVLLFAFAPMARTQNYSADREIQDGVEVIRLRDARHETEVLIAPSMGNIAFSMKVRGANVFWNPFTSLAEWKRKPTLLGNPLLAPWANRIDGHAFYANGKKYLLNLELGNIRQDGHGQPIHGLLLFASAWSVTEAQATDSAASVTSRLEFWRYPDWMAQFPFAHTIEMTYRLSQGVLEVHTVVENHSADPMPLSLGYHPYFQLSDAPRDQWRVRLPVRQELVLSPKLIPTGELRPVSFENPFSLGGVQLDNVYTGLARDSHRRAEFVVEGRQQKISVWFGEKYPVAVVYAPQGRDFICFEPMTGPTNAFNLAHQGKYPNLQVIPSGGRWAESFWIQPSGF